MQNNPPIPSPLLTLLGVLCLCTLPLFAQFSTQNSTSLGDIPDPAYTTAHLNGTVVSSLDGRPVARVLVTSPDQRMAAITDTEGRFSFDLRRTAPPGSQSQSHVFQPFPPNPILPATTIAIQINVRKPGYITGNLTFRLPSIQPDTPEPALQLKIVPAAVLTGHLDPESGDLPPNASVQLRRKQVYNGTATWQETRMAQVNSRGEFRFSNLQPGDYKLFAPAYDPDSQLHEPRPASINGFRPAFYPNTDSFESASPIHLNPGQTATANLTYHPATFYNITIPVTGLKDGTGFYANLVSDIPGLGLHDDWGNNAAQGYLPSGNYELLLASSTTTKEPLADIATVHLQVGDKPIRTEPVGFHPSGEIPVVVRREFLAPLPPPPADERQHPTPYAYVYLQSLNPFGLQPTTQVKPGSDQVATIQNLSEGLYILNATSAIGGYVASIISGTTDLLREPLRVLPSGVPRPIEITLRDDSASLNVRLAPATNMQPQAANDRPVFILCIQLDRPQAQTINFVTQQDQFPLPDLPPGRYLLLASHQPTFQGYEYHNEEALRDLIPKGATITLAPSQQADIQIPVVPDEEGN